MWFEHKKKRYLYILHGEGKSSEKKLSVNVNISFQQQQNKNILMVLNKHVMGCLGEVSGCCGVFISVCCDTSYLVKAFIPFDAYAGLQTKEKVREFAFLAKSQLFQQEK